MISKGVVSESMVHKHGSIDCSLFLTLSFYVINYLVYIYLVLSCIYILHARKIISYLAKEV